MKKFTFAALAALAISALPASAADMVTKARVAAPPPPPPAWDIAFGSGIVSDYIFRGITQSNHHPSVGAYFEPRYKVNPNLELYVGMAGASISFPNRAAAEIDFYAGFRPTFGKLALDFGVFYYWYPGGTCFNANAPVSSFAACPFSDPVTLGLPINGNVIKSDLSFVEVYAKASYAVTDAFAIGATLFYSPSVLNSGADGLYISGNAKYTFPALPRSGAQFYVSGEVGYWDIGTSDAFYGTTVPSPLGGGPFPNGIPYVSYTHWNVGVGFTWKVFTVEVRYSDTDLSRGDCNAFTSDQTATFNGSFTPINPLGFGSNWCGQRVYGKIAVDMTLNTNIK
jgi:hypothetical protein